MLKITCHLATTWKSIFNRVKMNNHTVKRAVVGEYGKSAHVTRREMIRQPPSLNLTMSQVVCVQQRECQINIGKCSAAKISGTHCTVYTVSAEHTPAIDSNTYSEIRADTYNSTSELTVSQIKLFQLS